MERLKSMKETLMSCVQGQMGNLGQIDTHELGEAIDMIKDLEEAMYYCAKTKEIEEEKKEKEELLKMHKYRKEEPRYYMMPYYLDPRIRDDSFAGGRRDMDRDQGRMYYPGGQGGNSSGGNSGSSSSSGGSSGGRSSGGNNARGGGTRGFYDPMMIPYPPVMGDENFYEREFPLNLRDQREGKSGQSRKMYMESKEMHKGKDQKMKDLEKYMKELSEDLVEMVEDASPEEKQLLEKKVTALASKLAQLNV